MTDELTAVQCKFYAVDHTMQKADIDSFFTASGKSGFSRRIIVSTSAKWSKHAEDPSVMPTQGPKQLRQHQQLALERVREDLTNTGRGQLIMACGTGKTFTSLKIAEDLVGAGGPQGSSSRPRVPSLKMQSGGWMTTTG